MLSPKCLFTGPADPSGRLSAAQRASPLRRVPQPAGAAGAPGHEPGPGRGAAPAAPAQGAAGAGSLAGRCAQGQQSAREPVPGHYEEADRPGRGSGPSRLSGESHGPSAGDADCVGAVGGASAGPPGSKVGLLIMVPGGGNQHSDLVMDLGKRRFSFLAEEEFC